MVPEKDKSEHINQIQRENKHKHDCIKVNELDIYSREWNIIA